MNSFLGMVLTLESCQGFTGEALRDTRESSRRNPGWTALLWEAARWAAGSSFTRGMVGVWFFGFPCSHLGQALSSAPNSTSTPEQLGYAL